MSQVQNLSEVLSEHEIQKRIMIALSQAGYLVQRYNVGKFKLPDGRWFDCGPVNGHPDLIAFQGNEFWMIEVKDMTGRLRQDQRNFAISVMKNHNIRYQVCRSPEEALEFVKTGKVAGRRWDGKKV